MTEQSYALEPQHLSFDEFQRRARIEPLRNHGRAAEVFFDGRSVGFVDAHGSAGLRQAHRREVNNALYAHSGDAPEWLSAEPLPTTVALADYPELRERFPLASQLVDATVGHAGEATA